MKVEMEKLIEGLEKMSFAHEVHTVKKKNEDKERIIHKFAENVSENTLRGFLQLLYEVGNMHWQEIRVKPNRKGDGFLVLCSVLEE